MKLRRWSGDFRHTKHKEDSVDGNGEKRERIDRLSARSAGQTGRAYDAEPDPIPNRRRQTVGQSVSCAKVWSRRGKIIGGAQEPAPLRCMGEKRVNATSGSCKWFDPCSRERCALARASRLYRRTYSIRKIHAGSLPRRGACHSAQLCQKIWGR